MTSHEADRGLKAELYARAGVPTYWLVDVPGKAVRSAPIPAQTGTAALRSTDWTGLFHVPWREWPIWMSARS